MSHVVKSESSLRLIDATQVRCFESSVSDLPSQKTLKVSRKGGMSCL